MTKPCPYCAEQIEPSAVKCRHCGEFLDGRETSATKPKASAPVKPGLQCPRCQSTEIKRRTRYLQPALTVLIAGVVMSMPFPDLPDFVKVLLSIPLWIAGGVALFGKSSCSACGHLWP